MKQLFVGMALLLLSGACGSSSGVTTGLQAAESEGSVCELPSGVIADGGIAAEILAADGREWFEVSASEVTEMLKVSEPVDGEEWWQSTELPESQRGAAYSSVRVGSPSVEDWGNLELTGQLLIGGYPEEGSDQWHWALLAGLDDDGQTEMLGCRWDSFNLQLRESGHAGSYEELIELATDPAVNADWARTLADPRNIPWIERDPRNRNLDPEETPADFLEQFLDIELVATIPETWVKFEEVAVCTFLLDVGQNECISLAASGEETLRFSGYARIGDSLEFALIDSTSGEVLTGLGVFVVDKATIEFALEAEGSTAVASEEELRRSEVLILFR